MPSAELWGCAKHATMGKTCCQTSEVMVTEGDKVRIASHLRSAGITGRDDFWADSWPADAGYVDDGSDPTWALAFNPDGSRPTLRRAGDGSCVFLGEAGCVLPLETRPLVCRLYPHLYDENGLDGLSDRCPREVVPPGSTILEVLDLKRADAERWHGALYAELREAPRR